MHIGDFFVETGNRSGLGFVKLPRTITCGLNGNLNKDLTVFGLEYFLICLSIFTLITIIFRLVKNIRRNRRNTKILQGKFDRI